MNYYVSGENVNGRPCRGVVHVVKKGDTLYKISRVYDVKVADLIWMNPGVRIYNLQVGDKICVPVSSWEMPLRHCRILSGQERHWMQSFRPSD